MRLSRFTGVAALGIGAAMLAVFGWRFWQIQDASFELERARQALAQGDLEAACRAAEASINLFTPPDTRHQAWLILGQAHLSRDRQPRVASLATAIHYLAAIPVDSPWYPQASLLLAGQKLFEAKRPSEADERIAEALNWHPRSAELRRWMIQRLTTTDRSELAEYELRMGLADTTEQPAPLTAAHWELLRTWLWSQFAPERIEQEFDAALGVAGKFDQPSDLIRLERWHTLNTLDPEDPTIYAAIAQWYLQRSQPSVAAQWLQEGKARAQRRPDPYFLKVAIRLFCETQQPTPARSMLGQLQTLDAPFYYHQAAAWVADVEGDTAAARTHWEAARGIWPGRIHRQLSLDLEQSYRASGSDADRQLADQLQVEREWLQSQLPAIQAAIESLESPASRNFLADVLQRLGRTVEIPWLRP